MTVKRKSSLLDRAKSVKIKPRNRKSSGPEEVELAIAWLRDEVTLMQMHRAIHPDKPGSGNVLYRIAVSLRTAYDNGQIKIMDGR